MTVPVFTVNNDIFTMTCGGFSLQVFFYCIKGSETHLLSPYIEGGFAMTPEQKSIIQNMRRKLCSYAEIAEILGFPSANTVKSYCYRNHLNTEELLKDAGVCKNCGKPFVKMAKTKPRIFCSDACKLAWWKNHVNEHKRTCKTKFVCQTCGTSFTDYPSSERKYCSERCYQRRNRHE